jgi:hypothetical protein
LGWLKTLGILMATIERAFELARSGDYSSIEDIRKQLRRERQSNVDAHLHGSLLVDLRKAMKAAKDASP